MNVKMLLQETVPLEQDTNNNTSILYSGVGLLWMRFRSEQLTAIWYLLAAHWRLLTSFKVNGALTVNQSDLPLNSTYLAG